MLFIMVSAIRSTTFLLIFILLPLRFSTADTQLQGKNIEMVRCKLETATSTVIYHGVAEIDQRRRFLPAGPGRKMMSKNGNVAKAGSSSTTKVKGKGKMEDLNHEEGRGIWNVKHKFSKRRDHYTKVKVSGFVPLNADYHVPRPHPPKNN